MLQTKHMSVELEDESLQKGSIWGQGILTFVKAIA